MAIARDASSPAAVVGVGNPTLTSASFTPPAGSRIVVAPGDCSTGGTKTFTISNTGMGGTLVWTRMATNATEACELWISSEVVSATSGTIAVTCNPSPGTVAQWDFVASVWTGIETGAITIGTHVVGAINNGGTSTTNSITPNAITTTFNNSQVVGNDIDDSASGAMTSTDSNTPATPASTGDGIFVWKAAPTPTAGTVVTLNFDGGGAGLVAHRWVAAELIPALSPASGAVAPVYGPGSQGPLSWQWQQRFGVDGTAAGPASTPQALSATETQTPTITTVTSHLKTLTATETQTPTIVRQTSKTLSATETQTPTIIRQTSKTLSATETQTPTLTKAVTTVKTLSATETQTPTISRVTAHVLTLSATETQTPTISRVTAHLLTLTATETQTITFNRVTAHLLTLSATETQTPTQAASRAFLRTMTVTETQTPTITATFQAGAVVSATAIPPLQHTLNRLAQTLASPRDAQGAANVWAGTTGLELVHALNRKAGTTGLELNGVAKLLASQLSGDSSLDADGALASIPLPGGAFTIMAAEAPTFKQRVRVKAHRVARTVRRHKVAASVGGVGVVGTTTALLRGILL